MEEIGGALGAWAIIIFIAVVLTFCLPFFVFKIRNQVTSINNKMDKIIELLGGERTNLNPIVKFENRLSDIVYDESEKKVTKVTKVKGTIKYCLQCGAKNKVEDYTCISCSKPLQ